ncbi:MAG: hypothetical protein R2789_14475 [Microthrixaceae bacterium]
MGLKSGEKDGAKPSRRCSRMGILDHTGLNEPTMKAVAKAMRGLKTETETLWPGGGGFRHLRVRPSMFDEAPSPATCSPGQ